ncbi:MAG TPA: 50S ribosomal protein L19e [archaeon]|nr:50S ribosomal protein L19e [archaeon]
MTSLQKRLAAKVLKVGQSKVWIDPSKIKDVEGAITKNDIRKMIKKGYIKPLHGKIKRPREKTKKRKGSGSRKGSKYSIVPAKRRWISTVRPLRAMLKDLRSSKQIDNPTYRKLYFLVKGGMFRNRSHLRIYLEQHDIIKKK